jgi:hypothetical protein
MINQDRCCGRGKYTLLTERFLGNIIWSVDSNRITEVLAVPPTPQRLRLLIATEIVVY